MPEQRKPIDDKRCWPRNDPTVKRPQFRLGKVCSFRPTSTLAMISSAADRREEMYLAIGAYLRHQPSLRKLIVDSHLQMRSESTVSGQAGFDSGIESFKIGNDLAHGRSLHLDLGEASGERAKLRGNECRGHV